MRSSSTPKRPVGRRAGRVAACSPDEARKPERAIAQSARGGSGAACARGASCARAAQAEPEAEGSALRDAVKSARSALATAEAGLAAASHPDSRFRGWLERRRGSLLWMLQATQPGSPGSGCPSGSASARYAHLSRRVWRQAPWTSSAGDSCGSPGRLVLVACRRDVARRDSRQPKCRIARLSSVVLGMRRARIAGSGDPGLVSGRARVSAQVRAWRPSRAPPLLPTSTQQQRGPSTIREIERGLELWCDVIGWSLHAPWGRESSEMSERPPGSDGSDTRSPPAG